MKFSCFTAALMMVVIQEQKQINAMVLSNADNFDLAQLLAESYAVEEIADETLSQLFTENPEQVDDPEDSSDDEDTEDDSTKTKEQMASENKSKAEGMTDKQAKAKANMDKLTDKVVK